MTQRPAMGGIESQHLEVRRARLLRDALLLQVLRKGELQGDACGGLGTLATS